MYYKLISYLKFLRKSTNAHGVHSPFVYKYVTQCLYSKKKWAKNKAIDVLLKSMAYFNAEHVHIAQPEIQRMVGAKFPNIDFEGAVLDVLFVAQMDRTAFTGLLSSGKLHNDSIILIDAIHKNPKKQQKWKNLISSEKITVSLDMYHCGAIFIRREQVKEHFTVRI
ncbi:MAG: hypothetical protein R2819_02340 [Allomuricauda sp.]